MKVLSTVCLFFFISISTLAKEVKIVEDNDALRITYSAEELYTVYDKKSGKVYENIKFVKRIYSYYQVLDENNSIFYFNDQFDIKNEVNDFMGLCGTVPHYNLKIKETKSHFVITSDETFYDSNNEVSAEAIHQFSKSEIEDVSFVNGQKEFMYTSNFGLFQPNSIDPNWLILKMDGKYAIHSNLQRKYDWIATYGETGNHLKTKKENLYGYYNIIEPQFISLENFTYYLAKGIDQNGNDVYIDMEGSRY